MGGDAAQDPLELLGLMLAQDTPNGTNENQPHDCRRSGGVVYTRALKCALLVVIVGVLTQAVVGPPGADVLDFGARESWTCHMAEARSQKWESLRKVEVEKLVALLSHARLSKPSMGCANTRYFGTPRYDLRLVSQSNREIVLGVFASGRIACQYRRGPGFQTEFWRLIDLADVGGELAAHLEVVHNRILNGRKE